MYNLYCMLVANFSLFPMEYAICSYSKSPAGFSSVFLVQMFRVSFPSSLKKIYVPFFLHRSSQNQYYELQIDKPKAFLSQAR